MILKLNVIIVLTEKRFRGTKNVMILKPYQHNILYCLRFRGTKNVMILKLLVFSSPRW